MVNANPLISSINSGEMSPRMESRVDFERYPNAAKTLRNMVLFPQGGVTRRPGTRFIAEMKDSSVAGDLIPFQFSQDDAYMVEVGNNYFRFYRRQARLDVDDTDAAISNGTFTSNITGWDDVSTGSGAISHDSTNGRLQLDGASDGYAWAEQDVSVGAGNTANVHVLQFRVAGYGGGKVLFRVGSATTLDDVLSEVELGVGEHAIEFTPGNTTIYIQFRQRNDPARDMWIDNVAFIDNAPMELVSPYATADLTDLRHFQIGDVVYVTHPDYAVRRLERRGHRSWSIVEAFFTDGPWLDINPDTDLDAAQVVKNPLFDNGMQDWETAVPGGELSFDETAKVLVAEVDGSGSTITVGQTLTVTANEKHVVHLSIHGTNNSNNFRAGTTIGGTAYLNQTIVPNWASYEFTPAQASIGIQFRCGGSSKTTQIAACLIYPASARLLEASATTGEVTLSALGFSPFTSDDVGRLVRMEWPGREPGYGVITAFSSSSSVTMLVLRKLASTTPTESWRLGAWSENTGYPTAIGLFDGRLVLAGTAEQPQTLWFSQSDDLQNMRLDSFEDGGTTVEDDDAIAITLNGAQIDEIVWLKGQKDLVVGTIGSPWIVNSEGAVITPDDRSAKARPTIPASNIEPVQINQRVIYADRSRRELREFGFQFESDDYIGVDLTILSDHIFRSKVAEMVYQQRPYSIIWARRADGRLATLSYNKEHDVLGWSQHIIGGAFSTGDAVVEAIDVIPGAEDSNQVNNSDERDELWMIVKRTINGATKRYIEVMEYFFDGVLRDDYDSEEDWRTAMVAAQEDAFYVDSGLTYDGVAATTITGLSHLEGQSVKVLADGKPVPDKTVASGQITLSTAAAKVHVGLGYKHKYESLKMAVGAAAGTSVNKVKIIKEIGLILLDCGPVKAATVDYDMESGRRQHGLQTLDFRRDREPVATTVPLYTGEDRVTVEGAYSTDARLYVEGDAPLPVTVLGLAPLIETRDRP